MRVSFIKISKRNENAFFYIVEIVIWFANKKGRVGLSTYVLFIEHREFDDKRSFDERICKREKIDVNTNRFGLLAFISNLNAYSERQNIT